MTKECKEKTTSNDQKYENMWWHPDKFEKKKNRLQQRAQMIRAIRRFFDDQNFFETETPILQIMPCADTHIHGFETKLWNLDLTPRKTLYLQSSPEFEMKKLLVAGCPKIYQICKVFRNGENTKLHSPEFTMIEWYRAHKNYEDIMEDCIGLLRHCAQSLEITEYRYQDKTSDPFKPWNKITVADAFQTYADIRLEGFLEDTDAFRTEIATKGIRVSESDAWDDLFFRVMDEKIEPFLGMGAPTILCDYPASMAALSRKKPNDPRFAERFELYICGIELANAFGELTDATEQRKRFTADMALKQEIYGFSYPLDEEFLQALEYGMPEAGGIALGIDRLTMLATHAEKIEDVLWSETLKTV